VDDIPKKADLHDKMAAALPPLSHLQCDRCKDQRGITTEEAADCFRSGWPVCCGHTMRLVTAREAAKEA
jgi:hypothetical protein